MTDPDSLHYERANGISRYRSVKDLLSDEDRSDWLDWFEQALTDEITYAAETHNAIYKGGA